MYKSNIYRQTEEILNYPSNKGYNLLSPPYNPKLKSKPYINQNMNVNISRFQPICMNTGILFTGVQTLTLNT